MRMRDANLPRDCEAELMCVTAGVAGSNLCNVDRDRDVDAVSGKPGAKCSGGANE
jgi:hypothetical protein